MLACASFSYNTIQNGNKGVLFFIYLTRLWLRGTGDHCPELMFAHGLVAKSLKWFTLEGCIKGLIQKASLLTTGFLNSVPEVGGLVFTVFFVYLKVNKRIFKYTYYVQ